MCPSASSSRGSLLPTPREDFNVVRRPPTWGRWVGAPHQGLLELTKKKHEVDGWRRHWPSAVRASSRSTWRRRRRRRRRCWRRGYRFDSSRSADCTRALHCCPRELLLSNEACIIHDCLLLLRVTMSHSECATTHQHKRGSV